MATKKKIHPADQADRDAVATASYFNVHYRLSPTSKINREAPTLIEAIKHHDDIIAELAAQGRKGKVTPLIYAIQPNNSQSPVPADMIADCRKAAENVPADIAAVLDRQDQLTTSQTEAPADPHAASNKLIGDFVASGGLAEIESVVAERHAARKRSRKALAIVADANSQTSEAAPKAERKPAGKKAEIMAAAERGELPEAPDFSAETHARFRKKLADLVALVEAGDIAGLEAFHINPVSSSPKAMDRYRNLAVIALKARAAAK